MYFTTQLYVRHILETIILQILSSVHTQNESHAAGTAFAISYQVCSVPSLLLTLFLILIVISSVRT